MIIVGLDPSLTATGLAVLDIGEDGKFWDVRTVKSGAPKIANEYSNFQRMKAIAAKVDENIAALVGGQCIDLAVIESPAYSKNVGMSHERAGLWWMLFEVLADKGCQVSVVKPNVRAKYATGNGLAGKDRVMLAASRRYPDAQMTNNNEADAVVLAAMGARRHGAPVEFALPKAHLDAMKTVR